MAFGRRKRDQQPVQEAEKPAVVAAPAEPRVVEESKIAKVEKTAKVQDVDNLGVDDLEDGDLDGPFDIEDFDVPEDATVARLDLGSVLIPMPPNGQIQVEMNQTGVPSAIWVVTPNGRFTIAAYAAPKSPGLWREVAGELAESLRKDNARVAIEDGHWGREVVGIGAGIVRFIGVDGYRWMIRCVVNGAPQSIEVLTAEARTALRDTVVRRGETPLPVRSPLPVQLPEAMATQLREAAARQQQQVMAAAQQAFVRQQQAQALAQAQAQAQARAQAEAQAQADERRGAEGSAMQQLRSSGTGA